MPRLLKQQESSQMEEYGTIINISLQFKRYLPFGFAPGK